MDSPVELANLLLKIASESVLGGFLLAALWLLRPTLQRYLDQQTEQLNLIRKALESFADRLDRVERKVNEIAEATDVHAR